MAFEMWKSVGEYELTPWELRTPSFRAGDGTVHPRVDVKVFVGLLHPVSGVIDVIHDKVDDVLFAACPPGS